MKLNIEQVNSARNKGLLVGTELAISVCMWLICLNDVWVHLTKALYTFSWMTLLRLMVPCSIYETMYAPFFPFHTPWLWLLVAYLYVYCILNMEFENKMRNETLIAFSRFNVFIAVMNFYQMTTWITTAFFHLQTWRFSNGGSELIIEWIAEVHVWKNFTQTSTEFNMKIYIRFAEFRHFFHYGKLYTLNFLSNCKINKKSMQN